MISLGFANKVPSATTGSFFKHFTKKKQQKQKKKDGYSW